MDNYLHRMRVSQQENQRKNAVFENLGSKYKGETTNPQPFSFVQNNTYLQSTKSISPPKRPMRVPKKTPKGNAVSEASPDAQVPIQNEMAKSKSLRSEDSKTEENYAKLRIHYSKDKYAEIKVYEDTDPDELAVQFCEKYNLAKTMKKQLYTIINAKLLSLKSLNEIEEQKSEGLEKHNEDLRQQFGLSEGEAIEHELNEEGPQFEQNSDHAENFDTENNPLATDSMNDDSEQYHDSDHPYQDIDDDDMRDSSTLPVPVENTFHNPESEEEQE
jgi:hypothetical protein